MAPAGEPAHLFPNAHSVQIMGGTFNAVQGGIHYHGGGSGSSRSEAAVWRALRAVPNFRKIYQDMLGKATEGTGMWLLKNGKFRVWLKANGNIKIFWGSGIRRFLQCSYPSLSPNLSYSWCWQDDARVRRVVSSSPRAPIDLSSLWQRYCHSETGGLVRDL